MPSTIVPGFGALPTTAELHLPKFGIAGSLVDGMTLTGKSFAGGIPSAAKFADYIGTLKSIDNAYYQAALGYWGIPVGAKTSQIDTALRRVYDLGVSPDIGGHLAHVTASDVNFGGSYKPPATSTVGANGVLDQTLTASRIGSAYDTIQNDFDQWGLSNLVPWAQDQIFNHGATAQTVLNELRYGKGAQHQEYENAFPGLADHNATNGVGSEHLTEAQYQTLVQGYQGLGNQYGLPTGFLGKQEVANLIKGNVSVAELQQRLTDGYVAAQNASPQAKTLLQQYYGIGPKEMTAYWLNPTKALPLLQRQIAAADIGGYAQQVGLSGLGQSGAEELASRARLAATARNQGLAASTSDIENSLLSASKNAELTGSAPGSGLPNVDLNSLIGSQIAGFGGTNQLDAQMTVDRAGAARAGLFDKGGGYDQTARGVSGVGGAST